MLITIAVIAVGALMAALVIYAFATREPTPPGEADYRDEV